MSSSALDPSQSPDPTSTDSFKVTMCTQKYGSWSVAGTMKGAAFTNKRAYASTLGA